MPSDTRGSHRHTSQPEGPGRRGLGQAGQVTRTSVGQGRAVRDVVVDDAFRAARTAQESSSPSWAIALLRRGRWLSANWGSEAAPPWRNSVGAHGTDRHCAHISRRVSQSHARERWWASHDYEHGCQWISRCWRRRTGHVIQRGPGGSCISERIGSAGGSRLRPSGRRRRCDV